MELSKYQTGLQNLELGPYFKEEEPIYLYKKVIDQGLPRCDGTNMQSIHLKECTITSPIKLLELEKLQSVIFEHCTFEEEAALSLEKCTCDWIFFVGCTCANNSSHTVFNFDNSEISNFMMRDCLFEAIWIEFGRTQINTSFSVWDSCLGNTNFRNVHFSGDVTFHSLHEDKQLSLGDVRIRSCIFSSASRISNFYLERLSVENSVVESGASLMIDGNTEISRLDLISLVIHGIVILSPATYDKFSISDSLISGGLKLDYDSIKKPITAETANMLKHEALKKNDFILARRLHKVEMDVQMKFLFRKLCSFKPPFTFKSMYKKWRAFTQLINLFLNYCSNDHGTSWVRGLGFTLFFAVLFTRWIYSTLGIDLVFDLSPSGVDFFVKGFLDVLNILNYSDTINGIELPWTGRVIHLISRVVIAYGVYQVVSAFRSYGKKA